MKLNNLLHFVELVGKLGLLVNGGKIRHPAPVIESDESGDDPEEEEGAHVVISGEVEPTSIIQGGFGATIG
jgi:hypothetical protein